MAFEQILGRLKGLRGGHDGLYSAFCPRCEESGGKSRSLSIKVCSDRILLKCHAPHGCEIATICEVLGIAEKHLFADSDNWQPTNPEKPRNLKFVCAYPYHDAGGVLRYQVARWVDQDTGAKTFQVRHPNPAFDPRRKPDKETNPRWLKGFGEGPRLLYRLPELLRGVSLNPNRWVLVVEGEKSVDYLLSLGLVATCNPLGAGVGKWLPEYSYFLEGCNVCIYADNDSVGIAHAQDVALNLFGLAREIKLLHIPSTPEHSGLDDYLAGLGVSPQECKQCLVQLVSELASYEPHWPAMPRSLAMLMAEAARCRRQGGVKDLATFLGHVVSSTDQLRTLLGGLLSNPQTLSRSAAQTTTMRLLALLVVGLEDVIGLRS